MATVKDFSVEEKLASVIKLNAPIKILLPAPVSPVMTFRLLQKSISISSMIA